MMIRMPSQQRRVRALGLVAGVVALACTACGPDVDLRTGVSSQPTSLLLGALAIPAPPAPVGVPVPSYPGVVTTPTKPIIEIPPVVKPEPVKACPDLPLYAAPELLASLSVDGKPKPGAYTYRQSGSSTLDGKKGAALPAESVRTLTALEPQTPLEQSRFKVSTTSFDGAKTEITYSLIQSPVPPVTVPGVTLPVPFPLGVPPVTVAAPTGLSIVEMTTTLGGTETTFRPSAPGLRIFDEPAAPTKTWTSAAVDIQSQVLLLLNGTYGTHKTVNACGKAVDGWDVTLETTILGLGESLTQTQHLVMSPQLGGLIVSEDSVISGTVNGHSVEQKSTSTINSITPKAAETTKAAQ